MKGRLSPVDGIYKILRTKYISIEFSYFAILLLEEAPIKRLKNYSYYRVLFSGMIFICFS